MLPLELSPAASYEFQIDGPLLLVNLGVRSGVSNILSVTHLLHALSIFENYLHSKPRNVTHSCLGKRLMRHQHLGITRSWFAVGN